MYKSKVKVSSSFVNDANMQTHTSPVTYQSLYSNNDTVDANDNYNTTTSTVANDKLTAVAMKMMSYNLDAHIMFKLNANAPFEVLTTTISYESNADTITTPAVTMITASFLYLILLQMIFDNQ